MAKDTDYIKKLSPNAERRFFASDITIEKREGDEDSNVIEGYAAVFEKDSEDFGGWIERIAPGAFNEVLNDDVFALFNHDANIVLGRNKKNVVLTQDETGLRYRIELPDTSAAKDLKKLVNDGIVSQSSFAFTVKEQKWERSGDRTKPDVRTIVKMKRLFDVSPVTYPAYPDTTVGARSFEEGIEREHDQLERDRDYAKYVLTKNKF